MLKGEGAPLAPRLFLPARCLSAFQSFAVVHADYIDSLNEDFAEAVGLPKNTPRHSEEFSDMKTGDDKILKTYYLRKDI